jgi:hypothetical protein
MLKMEQEQPRWSLAVVVEIVPFCDPPHVKTGLTLMVLPQAPGAYTALLLASSSAFVAQVCVRQLAGVVLVVLGPACLLDCWTGSPLLPRPCCWHGLTVVPLLSLYFVPPLGMSALLLALTLVA